MGRNVRGIRPDGAAEQRFPLGTVFLVELLDGA